MLLLLGRLDPVPPRTISSAGRWAARCPAAPEPVGVGADGRLTTRAGRPAERRTPPSRRMRARAGAAAYIDHELELRQLAQRANRANVSFYPLDPRGLDGVRRLAWRRRRPARCHRIASAWRARQDGLKRAGGADRRRVDARTPTTSPAALTRMLADTSSYYLLSYYSTNPKLDGRFRRITVRVKRPDAEVRARPGYLAPTEAEARPPGRQLAGAKGRDPAVPPASVTSRARRTPSGRGTFGGTRAGDWRLPTQCER